MKIQPVIVPKIIQKIAKLLHTQDVRMTSHPTYLLQEKNEEGNWRTREVFLTEEAATRHKEQFHYRYPGETRVYVESNHENQEIIAVREFLMSLVDKEEAHKDGSS